MHRSGGTGFPHPVRFGVCLADGCSCREYTPGSAAKHWIARVRIGSGVGEREHVVRDPGYADQLRDEGWDVTGPFVLEEDSL
jgi:hypothetical protein